MFVRILIITVAVGSLIAGIVLIGAPWEANNEYSENTSSPVPRRDGGAHDLANSIDEAASKLASSIANQLRAYGITSGMLFLKPDNWHKVPEQDQQIMESLPPKFKEQGFYLSATRKRPNGIYRRLMFKSDVDHFQGLRLSLRSDGDGNGDDIFQAVVFLQDRSPSRLVSHGPNDQVAFRLLTSIGQDNVQESQLDAQHHMAVRLRLEALNLARRRNWIEVSDEPAFLALIEAEYSAETLVGMGLTELTTRSRAVDESSYFESVIAWRGDRGSFEAMAESIADRILLRQREPWVKALILSVLAVFCVLGWFKVDWWLKGNYSIVNALSFVVVFSVSLGLIWSFGYDALI